MKLLARNNPESKYIKSRRKIYFLHCSQEQSSFFNFLLIARPFCLQCPPHASFAKSNLWWKLGWVRDFLQPVFSLSSSSCYSSILGAWRNWLSTNVIHHALFQFSFIDFASERSNMKGTTASQVQQPTPFLTNTNINHMIYKRHMCCILLRCSTKRPKRKNAFIGCPWHCWPCSIYRQAILTLTN